MRTFPPCSSDLAGRGPTNLEREILDKNSHPMAIFGPMSTYSVAEAKNRLPELIDRALKGEGVVITRHGRPVGGLKPPPQPPRAVSPADLDWLAARRIGRLSATDNAGTLVSEMRDEEER